MIPDDSPLLGVPQEIGFNSDVEIDNVLTIVKDSWLSENPNYEYFLAIDIVGSSNASKLHGSQFVAVQDTVVFDSDDELSLVIIDWTTDNIPRVVNEVYTVCVQVVRYDKQQEIFENIGEQACRGIGPF